MSAALPPSLGIARLRVIEALGAHAVLGALEALVAVLREAPVRVLVRRRVAGRDHFLSLDPKPMDEISAWIQRERAAWAARLDRLEAALRAEDAIEAAKKSSRKPAAKPRRKPWPPPAPP